MRNIEVYLRKRFNFGTGKYFVWWLTQQDCERITLLQQQALPEYISSELNSRKGRAGRGRLWVAPDMGLPIETKIVPNDMGDIGGIVIRGVDKKYLPIGIGKLTEVVT